MAEDDLVMDPGAERLIGCTDPREWARSFVQFREEHADAPMDRDEAFMAGWFAAALDSGRVAAIRRLM